ncbi:MAG: methionine--tRNA ligase [Bacteroidota bacterium]
MSNKPSGYTVTAALPYANGPIHIGHLAGAYLPADIYVRYLRAQKKKVLFICGSDEGGVAITLKANQEGISPQEVVDRYHTQNENSFQALGIYFDVFGRTSDNLHHQQAQNFFIKLYQQGALVKKESKEYYDEEAKMFLADRYLLGSCPHCSYDHAYGDQCEKCGSSLSSQELKNPRSKLSGHQLVKKKTTHWYLPLDRYEQWLRSWIAKQGQHWRANVYGQCKSWLDQGLRPRAMTRDLPWGVKVPLPDTEGKVLYVWFEAPIGYISATQAWAKLYQGKWQEWWQDPQQQLVHFIGKDNIVFHALIFPTMLHAHGDYILPSEVVANEFMNLEGEKISTSRNHAVWLDDYLKTYPGKEDVLRYVLCANAPESKDSNFTWEDFRSRNNHELVAILGNFINRSMVLLHKYFAGSVPRPAALREEEKRSIAHIARLQRQLEQALDQKMFRKGLELLMGLPRAGNQYLAETAPWKASQERCATILYVCSQIMYLIAMCGSPFLPFTMKKLRKMMNIKDTAWVTSHRFEYISPGHLMEQPSLLFEKIET